MKHDRNNNWIQDQRYESLTDRVRQIEKTLESYKNMLTCPPSVGQIMSSADNETLKVRLQDLEGTLKTCKDALANNAPLASKVQLLEQVGEAYKKSSANLEWAVRVIVGMYALTVTLFFGYIAYTHFRDREEYKIAVTSAKDASVDAKEWAEKAETRYDRMEILFNTAKNEASQWNEDLKKQYTQLTEAFKSEIEANTRTREELASETKNLTEKVLAEVKMQGQVAVQEVVRQGEEQIKKSDADWSRQRRTNELWSKGWQDYGAGEFQTALDSWQKLLALDPNDADTLRACGIALSALAQGKSGRKAEKYSALACEKFRVALRIKPDMLLATKALGKELASQAFRRKGEDADKLYAETYGLYEQASMLSPSDPEILCAWGMAMIDQAQFTQGRQADQLFEQANEKFALALDRKPGDEVSLALRGLVFSKQAERKGAKETSALYRRAYEELEKAKRSGGSGLYMTLDLWASTLMHEALLKNNKESEDLYRKACDLCLKAYAVDPNRVDAMYTWGLVLTNWAGHMDFDANAGRLLDDACSKIGLAAVKQPNAEYYAGWGFALSNKAVCERLCHGGRTDDSERCWEQASEKLEVATALDPCSVYAAAMRGRCLMLRAFLEKGRVRQSLISQARENCLLAESMRKGSAALWLACTAAFMRDESECRRWLEVAEEHEQLPKKSSPHVELPRMRFGNKAWYKGLAWKPE